MYQETEGILITIYKDVQENNQNINSQNNVRTKIPNILWSYYDRISIKKVTTMREYLFLKQAPGFVGNVQSFHLYRKIHGEKDKVFVYDEKGLQKKGLLVSKVKEWVYFALTSIRLNDFFTDYIQDYDTRGAFNLSAVADNISDCINSYMDSERDIAFEIYNSLGSEDFVIVMASNYLGNFSKVVELIRKIKFRTISSEKVPAEMQYLVETTHTIAGINYAEKMDEDYKEEGMWASVHLTLKNTEEGRHYWKKFNEHLSGDMQKLQVKKNAHQLFGAHDVEINIPINQKFLEMYSSNGLLNAENEEYKSALYQSQTTIYYEEKVQQNQAFLDEALNEEILMRIAQIDQDQLKNKQHNTIKYAELKDAIEEIEGIDEGSTFEAEMSILFSEYEQNINSVFSKQWHEELYLQMRAFIDNLRKYISYISNSKRETRNYLMRTIVECIESMKETYEHIVGGNRGVIDKERPISYYSGSYNNILRAYYGIIRTILYIGYMIPKYQIEKQHDVVFCVNFNITTRICSKICFIVDEERRHGDAGKALVSFDLPYDALVDLPKYIPHLIHETFHYILPINRVNRNKLLYRIAVDMTVNELLKKLIFHYIRDIDEGEDLILRNTEGEIDKYIIFGNHRIFSLKIHAIIEQNIDNDSETLFEKQSVFFYEKMEEICQCVENDRIFSIISDVICEGWEQNKNPQDNNFKKIREQGMNVGNKENKYVEDRLATLYEQAVRMMYQDICRLKEKRSELKKIEIEVGQENGRAYEEYERVKNDYDKMLNRIKYRIETTSRVDFVKQCRQALYDGFSEAVCDIYIFNLLDISFDEYLELFIPLLDTYCFSGGKKDYLFSLNPLIVRLGVLIDAFGESNKKQWLEKTLCEWKKNTSVNDKEIYAEVIKHYYDKYLIRYGIYRGMLIKYLRKLSLDEIFHNIQDVYSKEKCLAEKWKVNLEYLRNLYQRSKGEKKGLYSLNIEMIESFRYQRSLSQINQQVKKELGACSQHFIEDISFEVSEKLEKIHLKKIYLMNTVAGIGEYLEVISDKIKSFDVGRANSQIWFRGVCNVDFEVRASIFRSLPDDKHSLYSYMVENVKKLHEKTAFYPEIWKERSELISQIACLQHYGCPTNFLDCSLDALTALYFAINPDKKEDQGQEWDAAVYLIHPIIFNEEMDKLYTRNLNGKIYPVYCANVLNETVYKDYIPIDFSDACVDQKNQEYQRACIANTEPAYSHMLPPRTLIIPQNNNRIRAQLGTFIVYPLNMWPDKIKSADNENDRLEYGCLKKLQKVVMRENKNARKYIDKVVICSESIPKIQEQLSSLGIRKSRMYPDLPEIIGEIPLK